MSHGWEALRLGRPLFLLDSLVRRGDVSWTGKMLDRGAQVLSERTTHDFLNRLAGLPETAIRPD